MRGAREVKTDLVSASAASGEMYSPAKGLKLNSPNCREFRLGIFNSHERPSYPSSRLVLLHSKWRGMVRACCPDTVSNFLRKQPPFLQHPESNFKNE